MTTAARRDNYRRVAGETPKTCQIGSRDYSSDMITLYEEIIDHSTEGIRIFWGADRLHGQSARNPSWMSMEAINRNIFQAAVQAIICQITSWKTPSIDNLCRAVWDTGRRWGPKKWPNRIPDILKPTEPTSILSTDRDNWSTGPHITTQQGGEKIDCELSEKVRMPLYLGERRI